MRTYKMECSGVLQALSMATRIGATLTNSKVLSFVTNLMSQTWS
ncbi:hypothetical protein PO370_12810 [Bacteroides ovatus]|nr:hypothetical protein [Bacteroides ovatus]MDC2748257.1 hypothetical protein [Bacteroides ovatus]